jgi:transposase
LGYSGERVEFTEFPASKESPMSNVHCIAMDTHGKTTDICCKTSVRSSARRWHVATTIPALREVIESVPRPRKLTFEEGPLADWLWRELKGSVDELIVSDPRRNGLVAKDGDKDDPIDAEKLCDLQIGGYLRPVHHSDSVERMIFKRQVGLYHERVEHRVSEANKIMGFLKRVGVVVSEREFSMKEKREELLGRLSGSGGCQVIQENVRLLWRGYDVAVEQEKQLRRELEKTAKKEEVIERLVALPGIAYVRAATFVVYLDTPWRFASKSALWKYMGIGLVREKSGEGREYLHVELACNRRLKGMILGAAQSAIMQGENPFAEQHRRWLAGGVALRNAKRNVARSLSGVMWGIWKNGGVYDPSRVGLTSWQ